MRTFPQLMTAITLATGLCLAGIAHAQAVVVNGDLWMSSTPEARKAFLVGASNMIAMETAYAQRKGTTPPPVGTMATKAVQGMTLDQVADRITRWYHANPQRQQVPVMGVLWIDIVKPTASGQ
ncbi:MAG: hypothetical protein ACREX9_06655 [Gammaproteobacteria bacterium]